MNSTNEVLIAFFSGEYITGSAELVDIRTIYNDKDMKSIEIICIMDEESQHTSIEYKLAGNESTRINVGKTISDILIPHYFEKDGSLKEDVKKLNIIESNSGEQRVTFKDPDDDKLSVSFLFEKKHFNLIENNKKVVEEKPEPVIIKKEPVMETKNISSSQSKLKLELDKDNSFLKEIALSSIKQIEKHISTTYNYVDSNGFLSDADRVALIEQIETLLQNVPKE